MVELRTRARFPEVELRRGHYESFYLKAADGPARRGVWIRYTVHKRPGESPRGSVWFTLFDAAAGPPVASKVTLDEGELATGADRFMSVGDSLIAPERATGAAASEPLDARWELAFDGGEPPLRHLPRGWMYRAPLPRTKLLSPYPAVAFTGWVQAGDRQIELDGWPGMVGHNWGAQHAERWIWLHGAELEGEGGTGAWIDVALGRIRIGPWTTPWIANGVLALAGERHRLGGIERTRATRVDEEPGRLDALLPGAGLRVRVAVRADRDQTVAWPYADPDGSEHHSLNCSIADLRLEVERDNGPAVELGVEGAAAYELGVRERDHGIPLQPFPDG